MWQFFLGMAVAFGISFIINCINCATCEHKVLEEVLSSLVKQFRDRAECDKCKTKEGGV